MITIESISEKLGFNPLRYQYCDGRGEDDNFDNLFKDLSIEEINFIYNAALADPKCLAVNQ